MAYNKIQDNFWIDEKVRSWDFKTRMIALYLLSNQHRYSEGFYRLPLSYIAEDMELKQKEILKAVERLSKDNFIKYDRKNSMILIINALKYQPLQNINHCKAALNKLDELPASPLLKDFICQAEKYNPKFYNFLKKESKNYRFLKEGFSEKESIDSSLKKGIKTEKRKGLAAKEINSQALTQALTPAPAQTQTQSKTNGSQNEDIIFINKKFKNKKLKVEKKLKPAEKLCCYLIELIEKNNPRASVPKKDPSDSLFKKWATEIDRLKRLGPVGAKAKENKGYSLEEIRNIISFSQQDQFWKSNILSAKSLRKQVIKLENKMKNSKFNTSNNKTNMLKKLYVAAKEEEKKMQRSECIKILSYLNTCYNNRFKFPKPNDEEGTDLMIEVWFDLLKYYEYPLVVAALKKLIIVKPQWPPTPGEIVKEIEKLIQPDSAKISAGEAWYLALEAVRKYGYYNSKQGMESLPPAVREAVRNFGGFAALCHSQDTSFVKNQFIKLYQEVDLKRKENTLLPKPFKKKLLLISEEKEVQ